MASMKKIGKSYRITIELGKDINGKRKRDYITIKDKKIATSVLGYYNSQEKIGGIVTPNKKKFRETIEDWLYNHALLRVEINTFSSYYSNVYSHIIPKLGEIYTQQLKVSDLENYYAYLMNECGLKATTVRRHHANIHKALKIAKKNKEIINNIADDVELPKTEKYNNKVYNSEQIELLISLVINTDLFIPVMIGTYTGLRRSEVLGLRWEDIDFKEQVIHVRYAKIKVRSKIKKYLKPRHGIITEEGNLLKKLKNDSSYRDVPMSKILYDVLWKWRFEQKTLRVKLGTKAKYNKFVCTMKEDGREMKPDYISQAFRRVLIKNNLPVIRFHDLRGTLATLLIESDENIKYVSELLGHSNTNTTEQYYAKTVKTRMKKVANKIDCVLGSTT